MNIGILGAGKVGVALATRFVAKGHDVLVANSRGPEGVAKIFDGLNVAVIAASASDVLGCDIVFLATPWTKVPDVLRTDIVWRGRILVDATNIYTSYKEDLVIADLNGDYGSEIVARLAPAARVVKAFNTLPFDVMFAPAPAGWKRVLFVAGDDEVAVETVSELARQIDLHPVAAGGLALGGRLMELGGPFSLLKLFAPGEDVAT